MASKCSITDKRKKPTDVHSSCVISTVREDNLESEIECKTRTAPRQSWERPDPRSVRDRVPSENRTEKRRSTYIEALREQLWRQGSSG